MPQRPLSPSGLPDEASADERLVQVSDDLPEPRLVVPLDDEEAGAPVLENIAPVSLDGLSQYPEDLGAQRAPPIELLLTRPDSAAADSAVGQSVFPGSEPISPFPGWMSVADLYEPQDQLFLPVTPMGMPVELVEPVDADLDNWTASLESPSMFLDVSPVQVAMNDTVVHDVWVDGRRPTVDDTAVETVTTTTDTATTDTTTTDTTVDTPTTTTTDTPTDTPTTATTTDTKTATTDDDDDDGGGGGGGGATPSMSIADVTTSDESATNATFTVTLSESSTSDITVNYDSSNGTGTAGADYTATSGTLTISAGDTTGTFTVPILSDAADENNETATLTLSSASNATISDATATLTITDDDDVPSMSIADVTTSDESAANATFTATLSAASAKTVTVDYDSSNGTGTAGADYTATSGTLTISAGDTTGTFTVPILSDSTDENNETATLTLSSASNATISDATATLTITDDDDAPTLSINDVTASDESAANATFTATLSAASGKTVTVDYASSNDSLSFTAANIDTNADGALDVFIADMDGDGDLDIVSASTLDDTIAWHENDGAANPSWTAADIATSADGVVDVHVADMDGDGDLDIVSASALDDTIAWYENDGAADPSWTAANIDTNADYAWDVHVADLDMDGDLDIVSASTNDGTIAWYENDGAANPSWTAADIDTNADGALDVHVADMDGDGDLDIVSALGTDDTIAWYENDGAADPSWTAANIDTNADYAHDVHVADLDGDGDLDIVSASALDDTIAWYENDGAANPSWTAADIATSADGARDVHVADMDGDGDLDIVSASQNDDTIAWYENDGAVDPTWTAANIDTNADYAFGVHVADMDGDGDLDIVSASKDDDTIAWYESNASDKNLDTDAVAGTDYTAASGTLTFEAGDTSATFTVPVLADSAPENNETATMTLSSASNATISDATGTLTITDDDSISFTAANIATSADGAWGIYVADMDADGDLDIVSAAQYDDTIAWYENDGAANPSWSAANIATSANNAKDVYVADMDGDGDLDIVSASRADNTIAWYESDGAANPSWTAANIATSADGAYDVHVADMDGDGDLDIVSASKDDDTIAWYENDGAADPSWSAANIATNADVALAVQVADMDGDGDLDIVSASQNDDTIAWYENDGAVDPTWTAANIATSADGAFDVHVGDMDGDGDIDIISASSFDNTIAWYENDGASDPSWSAANIATTAAAAKAVFVGDIDGDGDLDIVSASKNDDTIAWYENDGAADPTWTAADIATNADGAKDVFIADMDGDGDLDIVSASSIDDTIAWYENTCDGSDPLVLDLEGDGIELLGLGSGVTFDVNVDGALETTGWVGPDDGLLAMDLDGSGQIEDMSEVFSEVFNGGNYTDSLAALASLDSNADQVISAEDDQFDEILVWHDSDSDGVSIEAELATLTDRGISILDLDVTASDETVSGNTIDAVGTVEFDDATTGTFAEVTFALDGAPTTFTLGGIISSGTEAVVEAIEPEFFVVAPPTDATGVTLPTAVQTASTLDEVPLDVAIAETVEEDPVETVAEVTFAPDGAPTTFTLGGIISSGAEAVVEATESEFFVVAPPTDATGVTIPTEVQTANTLDEIPLDVAIAETVEEDPVETLVLAEAIETAPESESEVSSDDLWLNTPATDYSVYPITDTLAIVAQTEQVAVAG